MTSPQHSTEPTRLWAARSTDLWQVEQLLADAGLPIAGLRDQFPRGYVVARNDDRTVMAAAGLELYGTAGLLRSVAVAAPRRNAGLGRALVADRLADARELQLSAVYLLTTSAANYFIRFGFAPARRDHVPDALASSAEFSGACPQSAECLAWRPEGWR
jgi:N-acetylglutamate synthase-like GNAT family acetyltransferase